MFGGGFRSISQICSSFAEVASRATTCTYSYFCRVCTGVTARTKRWSLFPPPQSVASSPCGADGQRCPRTSRKPVSAHSHRRSPSGNADENTVRYQRTLSPQLRWCDPNEGHSRLTLARAEQLPGAHVSWGEEAGSKMSPPLCKTTCFALKSGTHHVPCTRHQHSRSHSTLCPRTDGRCRVSWGLVHNRPSL